MSEFDPYSLGAWVLVALGAGAGLWAFVSTKVWPYFSKSQDKTLTHNQKIEEKQSEYRILEAGWASDNLAEEYHASSAHNREVVYTQLRDIKALLATADDKLIQTTTSTEKLLAEHQKTQLLKLQQVEHKMSLVFGVLSELSDDVKDAKSKIK